MKAWLPVEEIDGVRYFRSEPAEQSAIPLLPEIRVMVGLARSCRSLIRDHRPDILHPHSPILNAIPAIILGARQGVPVVYEMRSSWEDAAADRGTYGVRSWRYWFVRWCETWVCRKAARVVVICDGLKRELIVRGIPAERITVVPNGVDVALFAGSNSPTTRAGWSGLAGKKVIGFMGSFFRWEGLDLLVDAMAILSKSRTDVVLLLVGGGEMLAELKEKVRVLGLEQFVLMLGQVTQRTVADLYAQVDIMVFPRISTRLTEMVTPLKPLEAMAMKKAVVASDVGGHRELIRHGETGMLFRAGDVNALVAQLNVVLDCIELRVALEQRAFSWVRQERTWETTIRPYLDVYMQAL